MLNYVCVFFLSSVCFVLGYLASGIMSNWFFLQYSFYQIKITDVFQIILLIIISFFITHYVNVRTGNDLRRKEIVYQMISQFHDSLNNAYMMGCDYMDSPSKVGKDSILSAMKNSSDLLGNIECVKTELKQRELNNFKQDDCKNAFFEFKRALTDSPFATPKPKYRTQQVQSFTEQYKTLGKLLYGFKLGLYS